MKIALLSVMKSTKFIYTLPERQRHPANIAAISSRIVRSVLFNQMPNYLIAFVTGRCNMDCIYCCDIARKVRGYEELTPRQWAYALQDLKALLHLTVTGGEPFIREDLDELIISMVKSSGAPHVSINTNGWYTGRIYNATKKILTALPDLHLTVAVSVDGPPEVHDRLRNKPGAACAAYDTICKLHLLKAAFPNLQTRMQSLISPMNAAVLKDFFADAESWPVDVHEIIFPRDLRDSDIRLYSLMDKYKQISERKPYDGSLEGRTLHALHNDIINMRGSHSLVSCCAGGRLIEVLPDGTVIGCEMSKVQEDSVIGLTGRTNMRLRDICCSSEAERFREKVAQKCKCTFECAKICNIIFNVKNWPELILGRV